MADTFWFRRCCIIWFDIADTFPSSARDRCLIVPYLLALGAEGGGKFYGGENRRAVRERTL